MEEKTANCNTSRTKYSNYYLEQEQKVWAVDGMLMLAINETVGIRWIGSAGHKLETKEQRSSDSSYIAHIVGSLKSNCLLPLISCKKRLLLT